MKIQGINSGTLGGLSILASAALWGLFWIPMRHFNEAGLPALWSVAAINLIGSIIAVPVAVASGGFRRTNLKWMIILGLGMGLSNIFYFSALILSDVVRVTLLFYLLPIWATLFSRFLFGVPIGGARMFAIVLAITGIWLLLGAGSWPIPHNIGDVFGLLSGMGWAFGLTVIRGRSNFDGLATTATALVFAGIGAVLLGVVLMWIAPQIQPPLGEFSVVISVILPLAIFSTLVLWPTFYGQLWGAQYVAATTAAFLTMSEIVVATASTALLEGSTLSLISWTGGGFIILALVVNLLEDRHV